MARIVDVEIEGVRYISALGASRILKVGHSTVQRWAKAGRTKTGIPFKVKLTGNERILVPLVMVDFILNSGIPYKGKPGPKIDLDRPSHRAPRSDDRTVAH